MQSGWEVLSELSVPEEEGAQPLKPDHTPRPMFEVIRFLCFPSAAVPEETEPQTLVADWF